MNGGRGGGRIGEEEGRREVRDEGEIERGGRY